MEELRTRLEQMPGSYEGMVFGVTLYASKKESRLKAVLDYLSENENATPSDVVKFVSDQPDFFENTNVEKVS